MNLCLITLRLTSADKIIILRWEAKFYIHQIVRTLLVCSGHQKFLRLLITFSGAVRKMFRTGVIFGGTMNNHISVKRLWNVESKYIKILEIYRFG